MRERFGEGLRTIPDELERSLRFGDADKLLDRPLSLKALDESYNLSDRTTDFELLASMEKSNRILKEYRFQLR